MKETKWYCDGCNREFSNEHELLTFGSSDGQTLLINNNLKLNGTQGLRSMSNHSDIHFCSPECLHSFLFVPKKAGKDPV